MLPAQHGGRECPEAADVLDDKPAMARDGWIEGFGVAAPAGLPDRLHIASQHLPGEPHDGAKGADMMLWQNVARRFEPLPMSPVQAFGTAKQRGAEKIRRHLREGLEELAPIPG